MSEDKKEEKIKVISKNHKFWKDKKELSEDTIEKLEYDKEQIPKLIEFHRAIVKMCDNEIQAELNKTGGK